MSNDDLPDIEFSMKGSIKPYPRKKGLSYRAHIDVGDDERNQKSKTFPDWKYEDPVGAAKSWLYEWNRKIDSDEAVTIDSLPLDQYIRNWHQREAEYLEYNTVDKREWALNQGIIPFFGNKEITEITVYDIQSFYKEMLQDYSPASVRIMHKVLKVAFNRAYDDNLITKNPMKHANPPETKKPEMTVYDKRQIDRFLDAMKNYDEQYRKQITFPLYPLFYTALNTGLRIGELCGLRWEDLDLGNRRLSVKKSIKNSEGGGIHLGEPKTKSSYRNIILTQKNAKILRKHRQIWLNVKMRSDEWGGAPTVFPTGKGNLLWSSTPRRRLRKVLDRCNLPKITLHSLRHTHATMLLRSGVKAFSVSERLGHSSIKITMDRYTHYIPTIQRKAVDKYQKTLGF